LLGISGVSNDMRTSNVRRRLETPARGWQSMRSSNRCGITSERTWWRWRGFDVLAFTGGIGENGAAIREAVCRGMEWAGVSLDLSKIMLRGKEEKISKVESGVQIWIVRRMRNDRGAADGIGVESELKEFKTWASRPCHLGDGYGQW